ncbi:LuxR family transcriptional regulator, partial [Rhizobium sp. TRM95111]|uniref:helix-turn-helix transcriptional regulator n=1 Tax=Rhizobium alarense TaxID=2846851 RepID=UPI001F37E8A0
MKKRSCGTSANTSIRWLNELAEVTAEAEIGELLADVTREYGLNGYLLLLLPSETSTQLSSSVLATNWPKEMLRRYDEAGLIFASPVIHRLRRNTTPFTYDTEKTNRRRADGKAQIAITLFGQFGLTRGAYFPAHNSHGQRGALAFGGEREDLTPLEMAELNAIANIAFSKLLELHTNRMAAITLSRREVECLSWASAGKTSVEMSEILGLSEYTVNHYLNRATRKLDAVNRVQAVAKAIRAGLLN